MLRLVCALLLSLFQCLSTQALAQTPEADCSISTLKMLAAKAQDSGPPPAAEQLSWRHVTLPDSWQQHWPDHEGAVWYRIDWQSSCPAQPAAIALKSIVMAGEVFLNGELLWSDAFLQEPLSRSWNMPRYWQLLPSSIQPGINSLWIRVHGMASHKPGLGLVRIGRPDEIKNWFQSLWWSQRTIFLLSTSVSAVLCVLFAFAWLQNRRDPVFGWFALNSFCWVLFICSMLNTETWPFPSTLAAARANATLFMVFVLSFCMFSWRFGELHLPRLERALWIFSALAIAAVLFTPDRWMGTVLKLGSAFTVIASLTCLHFPLHALRTRKFHHLVYGACMLVFVVAGVHDALLLEGLLPQGTALLPYTTPLTMLALAFVLGRQITLNVRRIERFNQELTQAVTQACDDLGRTLEREHALALSHSRLQERLQISQDLHDSLGGSLVRSIALVELAEKPLHNSQVLSMFKLMRDDLRQMIDHGTSSSLQVPETPAQWIAPLRHRFGRLFEELELKARWLIPAHWSCVPSPIQCLTLTRVLEEALTNVIKHSRASCVTVEMQQPNAGSLLLSVSDDGIGFDVHAIQHHSMGVGMRSMLARMERVHGLLQIQSPAKGTVLTATIVIAQSQPDEPPEAKQALERQS